MKNIFGSVWSASGTQGTFGEGYWYHKILRFFGLCFRGVTFVAKTVTAERNIGNTPLEDDGFTPKGWFLKTVFITLGLWRQKACLNCYGLSQDGVTSAFHKEKWQKRTRPWQLSFMPVGEKSTWLEQAERFVEMVLKNLTIKQREILGLQFNASCPNTGNDPLELAPFIKEILDILNKLEVPIFLKINAQFPIDLAKEISKHPAYLGFVMGNTLPFGAKLPAGWPQVDWVGLFGTENPSKSPLALRFNGDASKAGGLSGAPLLPIVCRWIEEARKAGILCHINAGGGITGPAGVWKVWKAGANSISLGTITMFRPWNMIPTTLFAKFLFNRKP